MITGLRKFTTKITFYGISSFHFYRWSQFKFIPLACTPWLPWQRPLSDREKNPIAAIDHAHPRVYILKSVEYSQYSIRLEALGYLCTSCLLPVFDEA